MKKFLIFLLLVGTPTTVYFTGQPAIAKKYLDMGIAKATPYVQPLYAKYVQPHYEKAKADVIKFGEPPDLKEGIDGIMEMGQDEEGREKLMDAIQSLGISDEHTGNLKNIEGGFNKHQNDLDLINSLTK